VSNDEGVRNEEENNGKNPQYDVRRSGFYGGSEELRDDED